jgi:hypothetical protein
MPSTILSDNGVTSGTSGIKTTGSNDGTLALQTTTAGGAATTALTISTAQVVNFANAPTVAGSPIGASAATPTVLGTVYAKQSTSGGSPYLTAFGSFAATSTTGEYNTAVGNNALFTNVSGIRNSAFGLNALYANTGSYNTAVGMAASQTTTTATENSTLGYNAGFSNTTGSENVAIGSSALYSTTTGASNVAIGRRALYANTTGTSNTAVGHNALTANTTNNSNVAVGTNAGQSVNGGYENVFVGAGAGSLNTTGYFNICIGNKAGNDTGPTTGQSNTLIGNDARPSSSNASTQLVVASRQSRTGIGDNTGLIDGGTGGIYQGNNSSSWSTTSDRRLKKNIVDNTEGLDIISQIRVRNFEYKTVEEVTELAELPAFTTIEKTGVQLGVIAQELEEVCADCVTTVSTGVKTVDSDNLFWHMINAIKDLKAINDTQAATITALTARIVALENRV